MPNETQKYQLAVGMEVHAELKTETKMFCACPNDPDASEPNTRVCPVCMGHPGTLPVPNKKAIELVIKTGLALGCDIAEQSKFDRKNYFYPDLPKGYQISQYDEPLCRNGELTFASNLIESKSHPEPERVEGEGSQRSFASAQDDRVATVRIHRIHLEEDTGKLLHPAGADYSLVDFNRAGVPLMELVTEPDIHTAGDAKKFCEELQLILRYLGVSDADMEKGHMRCEANISISQINADSNADSRGLDLRESAMSANPRPSAVLGTKVEVKNLNSFKAVERAVEYEFKRQIEALERGEKIFQETRGWDDVKSETYPQRSKEEAHDYRYFPEPDIPPLSIFQNERDEKWLQRRGPSSFSKDKTMPEDDVRRSQHRGIDDDETTEPHRKKGWVPTEGDTIFIDNLRTQLSELPSQRRERFTREYGLSPDQIEVFVVNKTLGDYFEGVASELPAEHDEGEYEALEDAARKGQDAKTHNRELYTLAANYLINDLPRALAETGRTFDELKISAENFAEFVLRIEKGVISSAAAKVVLADMLRTGADPDEIIRDKNLAQVSDTGELESIVAKIIEENPTVAKEVKSGKEKALQFLVGQVMKETKGKANPKVVQELLRKMLG